MVATVYPVSTILTVSTVLMTKKGLMCLQTHGRELVIRPKISVSDVYDYDLTEEDEKLF